MRKTYEEIYQRIMKSTEHNIFVDYVFDVVDRCKIDIKVDFEEFVCAPFIDPRFHYEVLPLVMLYYLNHSHIDDDKKIPLCIF